MKPITKLTRMFAALRNRGYHVRRNAPCCTSCAIAAIGPAHRDVVFYHAQDSATWREDGVLHVRYYGAQPAAIGTAIVEEAQRVGLTARWSGDPNETVQVTA